MPHSVLRGNRLVCRLGILEISPEMQDPNFLLAEQIHIPGPCVSMATIKQPKYSLGSPVSDNQPQITSIVSVEKMNSVVQFLTILEHFGTNFWNAPRIYVFTVPDCECLKYYHYCNSLEHTLREYNLSDNYPCVPIVFFFHKRKRECYIM